jgi:MFS family permease
VALSDPLTAGYRRRRISIMPPEASHDATVLVRARAVRAFGDGYVAILLPVYLTTLDYSSFAVGAIATSSLVGSALLTLLVGLVAYRMKRRSVLIYATLLMAFTGIAFSAFEQFWPLLLVAFVGTLNPSGGDVSVFLPVEQSLLPQTVPARKRTAVFARYGLVGTLVGAVGALASGMPELLSERVDIELQMAIKGMFLLYALLGAVAFLIYRSLSPQLEPKTTGVRAPLGQSKTTVYKLAALFSLDSFGGGFVIQALLALYLFERFELSVATTGLIFFWTNLLAAFSILASAWLAERIGLIETMVFTHIPAQIALMLVPFMPSVWLALALLLIRALFSHMDIAPRNSYVMAVVSPEERPAAASVTSVPRSLAAAGSPLLAGYLFSLSAFGWPLLIGGGLKLVYNGLLLGTFRNVRPPEERDTPEDQADGPSPDGAVGSCRSNSGTKC